MAGCSDAGCSCVVKAGSGVSVTGSGDASNPYIINANNALYDSFAVRDTATVNLTLTGLGTPQNRFVLSADSTMKLTLLSDVNDPQGGPAVGEVPVWVGAGTAGHWEFQPPPANPGAVNVSTGLAGTGAAGTPLVVKMIGTSVGGSTAGAEVYADSAGNLRAVLPTASGVDWSTITNKPTAFPPSAHTHLAADITDQPNLLNVGGILTHPFYIQQADPGAAAADGSIWIDW